MSAGTEAADTSKPCDVRCGCGSLLARRVPGGIELKCRRCRRYILLSWQDDGAVQLREGTNEPSP